MGTGIAEGMEGIATLGIENIIATVHNDYTIAGSDSKARKRTMTSLRVSAWRDGVCPQDQ